MASLLKKSAIALSIALASAGAQATSFDFGLHDPLEVAVGVVLPGPFVNTYSFSIGSPLVLETSVTVANNLPPSISIAGGSYSLFSNPDTIIGNLDDALAGGPFIYDGTTGSTPHSVLLSAGNYHFSVTGSADGSAGGLYTLTSQVAVIPEPETYVMLLAGLGLMGFVARRRQKNLAAA